MKQNFKLLIQRSDRLGDLILIFPIIEQIKKQHPSTVIHVLASPKNQDMLIGFDHIDEVKVFTWEKPLLKSVRAMAKELKKETYDAYLCLWNNDWMALLGVLAGIPIRIGDSSNVFNRFAYTHKVYLDWRDYISHQSWFNMTTASALKLCVKTPIRRIPVLKEEEKRIQNRLMKHLSHQKKVVTIFCSTGGSNVPIPEAVVDGFVDRLLASNAYSVVLYCAPGEDLPALKQKKEIDLLNLLNETLTLQELAALISLSDFYVGADTGPTHMASFLNIPLVCYSYVKASFPTRWGPLSDFFRMIRHDYIDPDVDGIDNHISLPDLNKAFDTLVDDVRQGNRLSEEQKIVRLMSHTIRILYLYHDDESEQDVQAAIAKFREEGLLIFPYKIRHGFQASIKDILYVMDLRNITVLMGKRIPKWFYLWIRFKVSFIRQYYLPIYIQQRLNPYVSAHDFLLLVKSTLNKELKTVALKECQD